MAGRCLLTYIVLIPHDVEECVKWKVEVGSAKAAECAKDASSKEHSVEVLLCVRQQLLHLLLAI